MTERGYRSTPRRLNMSCRTRRPQWAQLKWARLRAEIYERDNFECQHCGWFPLSALLIEGQPDEHDIRRNLPGNYECVRLADGTAGEQWFELQIDHIIPVALGGSNDPDNLQTLCSSCNARKGASMP